jgi:hypothetical protein
MVTKMKHDDLAEDKKLIKKAFGMHDKQEHPGKKTDLSKLKKGGITMKKMCSGGKAKRYDEGGEIEFETKTGANKMIDDETRRKATAQANADIESEPARAIPKPKAKGPSFASKAKKAGFTSSETGGGAALMTRKMAKGGSASARADGCAVRGKTKGRMI